MSVGPVYVRFCESCGVFFELSTRKFQEYHHISGKLVFSGMPTVTCEALLSTIKQRAIGFRTNAMATVFYCVDEHGRPTLQVEGGVEHYVHLCDPKRSRNEVVKEQIAKEGERLGKSLYALLMDEGGGRLAKYIHSASG